MRNESEMSDFCKGFNEGIRASLGVLLSIRGQISPSLLQALFVDLTREMHGQCREHGITSTEWLAQKR